MRVLIHAAAMDVMSGELSRQRFDSGAVEPVVAWLAGLPGPVRACYEAGPTGFGLYRAARAAGIDCQVIAPSKTPRPSGDRNKTDRKDAELLLRQLMAGALTAVAVPPADVRGGAGSREGARAGPGRSDALPAPPVEAAVASRPRLGPHGVDEGAPSLARRAALRASERDRARVYRHARRVRRADRSPRGARRAALAARARTGVLAAGSPAACVPRDRHADRVDPRARDRRLHPLPARGAARLLARARPLARPVRGVRHARVGSPRPAPSTRAGSSSRPPGITPARRGSAVRSASATRACPTTSSRSPCAPSRASTASTNGSANATNPAT